MLEIYFCSAMSGPAGKSDYQIDLHRCACVYFCSVFISVKYCAGAFAYCCTGAYVKVSVKKKINSI